MADRVVVKVEGLKEFRRAVVAADRGLGPEMRKGFNEAGRIVIADARPGIAVVSGKTVLTLKARSTQREGRIEMGGPRAPGAGFYEFGGTIDQPAQNRTLHRPFIPQGRNLFPAAARNRDRIVSMMDRNMDHLARRAGLL